MQSTTASTFTKSQRLLNAKDYKAVFDQAEWKVSCKQLLCLASSNQLNTPRLGLVVAKKNVKLAVERNRIKRIIRESFRQHSLQSIDIVVMPRKSITELTNSELHTLINKQWQRLANKANVDAI